MVEVFNINDLIYKLNAGQKSENTDNRKERTYKEVLDTIRHVISTNHSAELINVMYSEEAKEKLKNLIVRYLNQNKMSVPECESISDLADKIYEDMAGFGILSKYITEPTVEEINVNAWNSIEVIYPDRIETLDQTFINPDDCMDKIKKMVWLGGSIVDGSAPTVDSFIGEGIRISAIIPPCVDKKTGGVASIRRQKKNVITRELMIEYGSAIDEQLDFLSLCVNHGVSLAIAGSTGSGKTTDLSYSNANHGKLAKGSQLYNSASLDDKYYIQESDTVVEIVERKGNFARCNLPGGDDNKWVELKNIRFNLK